ncbi:MAG: retroviral-like aspartic protease family protein [Rubrivivax sp.]|nr:retroviral-like aspartic protease family protein [Rubrivivax sp.]
MRGLRLLVLALLPALSAAQNVSLAGHMGQKALLLVDGQPVTLAVGEQRQGVRLLKLDAGQAQVEWGGRVSTLRVGEAPASVGQQDAPVPNGREVVLSAGPGGHFLGNGAINGRAVRFMVDTGASVVALGRDQAERIGLDTGQGRQVMMQTANGSTPAQLVTLSEVTLGDVTVANVQAVVMPQPMAHVLLGNSFLQRFQMRRDNDVMRLELR